MNKKLYIILLMLFSSVLLYSKGETEESDYKSVTGKENWEHEVPIGDLDPGEYNLLIRAKDKASNESFAGPFDIFVDPESDKPIVSITNPSKLLRVGGVLNIVGTARDDDAVKEVYIKLNDGEYFLAEGQEFWNYTLQSDVLEDGQHIITAKAVDVNGLEGYETTVVYNQDTIKPVNTVENFQNGAFFTGKVTINGRVVDANGVKSLEVSTDEQVSYNPVKLKKNDDEDFYTFELDINTLELEDGPNIYWFKSQDFTGSIGYSAFLFFVDNVGPEVTIISPKEGDILNGFITVTGKISDVIGVKNFKSVFNNKEEAITLLPGNPYWSQKIDLTGLSGDKNKLLLVSEDKSGNISEVEVNLPVNNIADKPILTLDLPKTDGTYKEVLTIEGSITDDDKVKGIIYSVDKGEPIEIPAFGSFKTEVKGLTSGAHSISIKPVDIYGVVGDEVTIPFSIEKYSPVVKINSVNKNGEEKVFYPGVELQNDKGYSLLGSISAGNSLTSLKYKLGNSDFRELKWSKGADDSVNLFEIPVDTTFSYGVVDLEVVAEDNFKNSTTFKSLVYITNYTVITEEWGLLNIMTKKGEDIKLTKDLPFKAYFNGPAIKSVKVVPETDFVDVNFKGRVITVTPKKVGRTGAIKIVAETDKGEFETKDFSFIVDNENPVLELDTPKEGETLSKVFSLSGTINEFSLDKLKFRFSTQDEFTELKWRGTGEELTFRTNINIPETESESMSIELVAIDKLGNRDSVIRSFNIKENEFKEKLPKEEADGNTGKGSDKPVLFVNFPRNNHLFLSNPTLSGFTRDDDSVKEITVSEATEGGKSKTFKVTSLFDIDLKDFGTGSKNLNVVVKDINNTESKPVKISYRYISEGSAISINGATEPSGKIKLDVGSLVSIEKGVTIDGEIIGYSKGSITYTFNDGEFKSGSLKDGKFSIPVPGDFSWGRHNITVIFTDDAGRESKKSTFFYIVDKVNTKGIKDDFGFYINDIREGDDFIDLTEESFAFKFHGRKIKELSIEVKGGDSNNFVRSSYKNDEVVLSATKSGLIRDLRVKVVTIDGDEFTTDYFNFISDKVNPVLEIESPTNYYIQGEYILAGRYSDDLKTDKLQFSLNQGATWSPIELKREVIPETEEYTTTSTFDTAIDDVIETNDYIFSEVMDFSNRPDRGYSIWVKATDLKGNEVIKVINLIKDTTDPNITLLTPGKDEINGVISLIGSSRDNIALKDVRYSKDGVEFIRAEGVTDYSFFMDFGVDDIFPETFTIRATDMSGNYKDIFPKFNVNKEKDKPVVQIQTPTDGEVIRNDFTISGMAFDDDGVDMILYSLDGGEFQVVSKKANNFSINIPLESITNNDHLITVKAIDILGVESDIVNSTFWVSKEEPVSSLTLPKIEETKRGMVTLSGTSFDKNGIKEVYVSTDNGVSYQKAIGQEDWSYEFNTKNIKDGTYSIFVKSIDKLETVGFYSTLMNIDNTPPELKINEPYDGDILSDKIVFSGRSFDNIGLREVNYRIYSHSQEAENLLVGEGSLSNGGIFNIDIPLEGYATGDYNIELIAFDNADNRSILTRNFTVTEADNAGDLEMLFPQAGSEYSSRFEVAGKVIGRKVVNSVDLYIDDEPYSKIKVNEFKYFNLNINTLGLSEGAHTLYLRTVLDDGQIYETPKTEIFIKNSGAWLNIVNMKTGDNISGRPYLRGEAGFIMPEADKPEVEKEESDNKKEEIEAILPVKVEVSLDNGQIFQEAKGASTWEFRVETWQYNDGLTPILVRAHYSNGDIKTSRIAVNIDRTKPEIEVLESLEQGRFNESISLTGIAEDSNGLTDISVVLRDGKKAEYEIPELFQGMFIDIESGYGKTIGGSVGLTFFDDNVKLAFTAGDTRTNSDDDRIKGIYYGGKLLANIQSVEFGSFLGPDWNFFSMSAAIGASFTQKTLIIGEEERRMWYSSIIGQIELAKIKLYNDYLSSIAVYGEYEATLISSESDGGFVNHIGIGTRLTLF